MRVTGETLSMKNFKLPSKVQVPIFLGALNQQMLRLAGALADGSAEHGAERRARAGARGKSAARPRAGRDPAGLEVVARLHVCVMPSI